jgi:hypothetical protein
MTYADSRRLLSTWPTIHNRPAGLDITVHAHVLGHPYGIVELVDATKLMKGTMPSIRGSLTSTLAR